MARAFSKPAAAVLPVNDDPLSGATLFADVERYASFGIHRYGTDADAATTDWIAGELTAAGLATEFQPFVLDKQYSLDSGAITLDGQTIDAVPFWWLPEDKASFELSAPLAPDDADAAGKIVWLSLPFDRAAYLDDSHRQTVLAAAARKPVAIVLTIDNPGEDIYLYNVGQDDAAWPVPVVVVASKHAALLTAAQRSGAPLRIAVRGSYQQQVAGRNVIGRLDRKAAKTIVLSTPMTGWFSCVGERAPGIASFLALARSAAAMTSDVNLLFVATAGHEIGHGGMEVFLGHGAPKPADTLCWIHFGASNASYQWTKDGDAWVTDKSVNPSRLLISSPSADALTMRAFAGQPLTRFLADKVAIGELREVKAAGYTDFFGMAGRNHFFHNPTDSSAATGPEILEPIVRAFHRALATLMAEGDAAFVAH